MLRPERSRGLIIWWLALHLGLGITLVVLPVPAAVSGLIAVMLLGHAAARFPGPAYVLVRQRDGRWSLPELERRDLRAVRGSFCAPGWIRLVLVGPGAERHVVLLLRDQLSAGRWCALQAALRRSRMRTSAHAVHARDP